MKGRILEKLRKNKEYIIQEYKRGNLSSICKEFDCSNESVYVILRENNVVKKRMKYKDLENQKEYILYKYNQLLNVSELSREIGCDRELMTRFLKNNRIDTGNQPKFVQAKLTKEKEYIEKLYKDRLSCKEIAKILKCSTNTIKAFIKDKGIQKGKKTLELNIDDVLDRYYNNEKLIDITKKYNCEISDIYVLLKKLGLPVKHTRAKQYSINEEYFDKIDSEDKAYFLGFIFADGCVFQNKGNKRLSIELNNKDCKILELFNIYTNSTYPIKTFKRRERLYCRLTIHSHKIFDSLVKLGCMPKKTYNMNFPNIQENLVHHFIRGFFDGDGSVFKSNNKIRCKIVGTSEFLDGVSLQLEKINIYCRYKQYNNNIPELTIQKHKDVVKFYRWMYNNSNIYMDRKYNKFKEGC